MPKKKKKAKVKKTYVEGSIVKARHLPAMDDNGLSDPFVHILLDGREVFSYLLVSCCFFSCAYSYSLSQVFKTKILYKTRFPVWEEAFKIDLTGLCLCLCHSLCPW